VKILLGHPIVRGDARLVKIFRIIDRDEPSHWAPYDEWLRINGRRPPSWWVRAIDQFIHGELLFLKLPLLFATPRLSRRSTWPDEHDRDAVHRGPALAANG
jgi:hypothetical protein